MPVLPENTLEYVYTKVNNYCLFLFFVYICKSYYTKIQNQQHTIRFINSQHYKRFILLYIVYKEVIKLNAYFCKYTCVQFKKYIQFPFFNNIINIYFTKQSDFVQYFVTTINKLQSNMNVTNSKTSKEILKGK